jgi:hypothetical protein
MWSSAAALGSDSLGREAPRGATELFAGRYAAPDGADSRGYVSYPRLPPWARLCRPWRASTDKNRSPYLRTGVLSLRRRAVGWEASLPLSRRPCGPERSVVGALGRKRPTGGGPCGREVPKEREGGRTQGWEAVKKCHKSHTTQRHEGTRKKADFRSERPDMKVIQQLVRIDRLRTVTWHITLLSFLASLCGCVVLVVFFSASGAVGYAMSVLQSALDGSMQWLRV